MKSETLKKYLFEFIVIFLSITFSFIVEEWRTNKQQEEITRQFLVRLTNELKLKSAETQRYLLGNKISLNAYKKIFENFTHRKIRNDSILKLSVENQAFLPFEPNLKTWESIVNSGNLNDVNIVIIDSVTSLLNSYQEIKWMNDVIYDYSQNIYYSISLDFPPKNYSQELNSVMNGVNKTSMEIPDLNKFLNNNNAMDYYASLYSLTKTIDSRFSKKLVDKERRLIELIDKEVN